MRQRRAYGAIVRDSDEIDRAKWSGLLSQLLLAADLTPETAAAPVGPVDANWRTIRKWLSQENGVSARRVRDVARALGYPVTRALVEVGFLTAEEVGISGLAAPPAPAADPLIRRIVAGLRDPAASEESRTTLRRLVQAGYESWQDITRVRKAAPQASAKKTSARARS